MTKHLEKFRRTLRKEDQGLFDELFERARQHPQAADQVAIRDLWNRSFSRC
jgi:hypothetical protein